MTMHHYAIYETATGKVVGAGKSTNKAIIDLTRKNLAVGQSLYVGEIDPATTFLPGGFPAPKPVEAKIILAAEVKAHAGRLLSYTDWYVTRQQESGTAIPDEVSAYRQAVRERSGEIEAMQPIPADFTDSKHWPASP